MYILNGMSPKRINTKEMRIRDKIHRIEAVKSGNKTCIDCGVHLVFNENWFHYHVAYRCRKCLRAQKRKHYWEGQRDRKLLSGRIKYVQFKIEVLSHYSTNPPICAMCDEDDIRVLSIDHIKDDGAEHRRKLKKSPGANFYRWLRKNNYPPGYQVLCMNCQYRKRWKNNEIREVNRGGED